MIVDEFKDIIAEYDKENPDFDSIDKTRLNGHTEIVNSLEKARRQGLQPFKRLLNDYRRKDPKGYAKGMGNSLGIPELLPEVRAIEKQASSKFFAEYERYSKLRSPRGSEDYHTACACWLLSTVAARRVRVEHAGIEFYTPLMVALIGRSTYTAKTKTCRVALSLLKEAGLQWLLGPDETTPQKMLSAMAGRVPANYNDLSPEKKEIAKNRFAMAGQRGWFYDEFGQLLQSMLQVNSPMSDFAGLLRRMDECMDSYSYETRAYGEESIEKPYLSLLATLTPSDVAQQARKHSNLWSNGFWARFLLVTPPADEYNSGYCPDEIPKPTELIGMLQDWHERLGMPEVVAVPDDPGKNKDGQDQSQDQKYTLSRINDLPSDECWFTPEAKAASRAYEKDVLETNQKHGIQDLDSSIGRLMDKAVRIAALVASLENDGEIGIEQWAMGQKIAETARRNLYELYYQVNTAPDDTQSLEDQLVSWLETQPAMTIRDIQHTGPMHVRTLGSKGIKELVSNLVEGDVLQVAMEQGKKAVRYQLAKSPTVASVAASVAR